MRMDSQRIDSRRILPFFVLASSADAVHYEGFLYSSQANAGSALQDWQIQPYWLCSPTLTQTKKVVALGPAFGGLAYRPPPQFQRRRSSSGTRRSPIKM